MRQKTTAPSKKSTPFSLSCILYAYNDAENIRQAFQALKDALDDQIGLLLADYEIVLVNDGSDDLTKDVIRELQKEYPNIKAVHHVANEGMGAAFVSGLSVSQNPFLFFSTADNRFDYGQVVAFLTYLKEYDAVVGFRPDRQDPILRKYASHVWNFLVNILFGWKIQDIDCAFKMYRLDALAEMNFSYLRSRDSIINTEILTMLKKRKARILEAPVTHLPVEYHHGSGVTPRSVFIALWKVLGLRTRLTFQSMLGYFGFITGAFSRSERPMEVILHRRSLMNFSGASVSCRLCGAQGSAVRKTKLTTCDDLEQMGHYEVFYCTHCKNAFTHPVPDYEDRLLMPDIPFEEYSYVQKKLLNWFLNIRVKRVFEAAKLQKGDEVLDIGGGACRFANQLAKSGIHVTVIEPNEANAAYADRDNGVTFISKFLDDALLQSGDVRIGEFDAVTMWHSLEHFPDPLKTIQLCRRLLKPGGCLYICVPNINSMQADLGGNWWTYLDVPHHLAHFTLDGLTGFLKRTGYQKFRVHWLSQEYEIFGFYQTLLNLITSSHNYYYNSRKKGPKTSLKLRYPLWTKMVTRLGFTLLPLAGLFSFFAFVTGKPSCVEMFGFSDPGEFMDLTEKSE